MSLTHLYLGVNSLSGTVPPSLYYLSSLIEFAITENNLSGNFLANMRRFSFPQLRKLGIALNQFTVIIPETLSNISGLELLDIGPNYLTGQVPDNLGVLKDLQWLNLENNNLGRGTSGDLKFLNSLTNISSLRLLNFRVNNFGGVLPQHHCQSLNMQELYFEDNKIFGSIPEEIRNLISLTIFEADNNYPTGAIPTSIGKLQSLRELDLSWNRLSGLLPSSLGNLSLLYYLNMSHNDFEGTVECWCLRTAYLVNFLFFS